MKIFKKTKSETGRRRIYLFGIKILSYKKKLTLKQEINRVATELLIARQADRQALDALGKKLTDVSKSVEQKVADVNKLLDQSSAVTTTTIEKIKQDCANSKETLLAEIRKRNPQKPNDLIFYWDEVWANYLKNNDISKLTSALKKGTDKYSIEYIETFLDMISLLPHKNNITLKDGFGWTSKDAEYSANTKKYITNHKLNDSEKFMFANMYGLIDIYDDIKDKINGKDIIDGGAYTGNTALLFSEMFDDSKIYSFEPMKETFKILEKTIKDNGLNKVVAVQKGLGNEESSFKIHFNNITGAGSTLTNNRAHDYEMSDIVEVTTIDIFAKENQSNIGFIKLDIEGFEKNALIGAQEVIKANKPVIVAALYHNPVDFFEIKDYLQSLNKDYKFMIRRAEKVIPLGDIVLIAY